jgi:hypothetical protein
MEIAVMAKRCWCEKVFDMLERDWRFRTVGDAASMFWLTIVRTIERYGGEEQMLQLGFDLGRILGFDVGYRLGSCSGSSARSLGELALMTRTDAASAETHLRALIDRQLLVLTTAGLGLPIELALSAKALAARKNGRKGGRPRSDGQQPSAQRNFHLPIAGGLQLKPTETQTVTQNGNPLARASSSLQVSINSKDDKPLGERETREPASVSLARQIGEMVGRPAGLNAREQEALAKLADEMRPTSEELLAAFREMRARPSAPETAPISYYLGGVKEGIERSRRAAADENLRVGDGRVGAVAEWSGLAECRNVHAALYASCGGDFTAIRLVPNWVDYEAAARDPERAVQGTVWGRLFLAWCNRGRSGDRPPSMLDFIAAATDPAKGGLADRWATGFLAAQHGTGEVPAAWDDFIAGAQRDAFEDDPADLGDHQDLRGVA